MIRCLTEQYPAAGGQPWNTVFLPPVIVFMAGIYLHIPFCRKACHYCNFHFSTSLQRKSAMVDAMQKEILLRRNYLQEPVHTIYFGGGTPSLLETREILQLLEQVHSLYPIATGPEITLETNPDDITAEKLSNWKEAGINRLSIGIQSFREADLRWMNRAHNAVQAKQCIELAIEAGFTNLTIDLIYGTPGLTNEDWQQNIETALSLQVPHLSCYALTVEPRTALAKKIATQQLAAVDPDIQEKHFRILTTRLQQSGFEQYEISNFALPGFRSRHNSSYWQGKPYLGIGPSAHSFNGRSRQWNIANNALYLASLEKDALPFEEEVLTETQRLNEYIMLSLRTIEGLSLQHVLSTWGKPQRMQLEQAASPHLESGRMRLQEEYYHLTEAGKFLADGIAADLFCL